MEEEQNYNITDIVNNQMQPVEPIQQLQQNLQQKAIEKQSGATSLYDSLKVNYLGGTGIKTTNLKPSIETQVPISEGYNLVGDEYIAKYPTYELGRDNAEYAAQTQSSFDKWSNGLTKAGANLLTTIAGNTVGFVVGVAEGVSQQSWNAVFDNKFSNTLADWNDKLEYKLPNYVSKDEQDDNFGESLLNANFWAKDVMGGFSFTVGTIASEAIWAVATGGIANSAKWGLQGARLANKARWGKVALGAEEAAVGLANYKKFVASGVNQLYKTGSLETTTAGLFANTAKTLNTARFLSTTSGNEAGIEALQYKREQTENFYRDFEKINGRNPSQEEITEFNDNLEASANAVFATNLAILFPSNIAMFGSLANIISPTKGLSKAMNKSLFGIGVEKTANEAGELAYKGLQATGKQKVAQYTYAALKPLVTEGLWEEGLQGVTTKTAENWITSTYDPKYNNKTISLADATYKALAEQYGSKEGWKEIGIGALIGGGSSLIIGRGKFQEVQEFNEQQKYQEDYVAGGLNRYGDQSALATDAIVKKVMFDARVSSAVERQKEAIDKGDDVTAALSQQDQLLAEMQFRKAIGENTKDLVSKYETAVNALPDSAFEERNISDVSTYKESIISGYKDLVSSYERASDFADAVLGESKILGQDIQTQTLKDALTYSIVSGEKANKIMNGLLSDMGQIIGTDSVKAMKIQTELQKMGKAKQQQVRRLNTTIEQTEQQVKTLSRELQRLQISKDEEKGTRLQQVQGKLTDANEKIVVLKAEREVLAQEVSQESKRRTTVQGTDINDINLDTEFITGNDLADIDQKLQRIEDSIKSYQGVNHEIYYDLLDLKRQYVTAKENFFSFQSSVDAIISDKFAPKFSKANGLLGKLMNSKAPIDNFTKQYLEQLTNNYINSVARSEEKYLTENIISDQDYAIFKDTGEVSQEILSSLAEKIKVKDDLTTREREIYEVKTNEINLLTQPNPNKPDLTVNQEVVLPLSEAEKLRRDIEEAFNKDYPLLTQDVDEMIKGKPSKEEVDRYQYLYKQQENFTEKQRNKFEELQPRMQRWFMAQSLPVRGATIADLVELLSQLETTLDRNQTLDEINSDELVQETAQQKDSHSTERQDILQNISGNAVVKIVNDDIHFIHIDAKTIIDRLLPTVSTFSVQTVNDKGKLNKAQDLTPKLLTDNNKKPGTVFNIGNTKITIGQRGSVVMPLEDYYGVQDILNMYYFNSNSGKWSYADVYEFLEDGSTRKVESEFETNTISDYLYNASEGDSLNLFVDMRTDWNQDLVYESLQELEKNGEISAELKKKIQDKLEITSRKGRENNSTLKALYDSITDDNFAYVRKKYAERFIQLIEAEQSLLQLPNEINLEAEVNVQDMFLGTPNFQLDNDLQPKELPITERGAETVITQGYVLGDETILANKKINTENVSRLYVTNLARLNPERKIPVVVLQKGQYKFLFPITMVKTTQDQSPLLEDILISVETDVEASKLINNLMISLGSNTRVTGLNEEIINDLRAELSNYTVFRTADEITDINYDKNNLISDATIKIDLENEVISSPKVTVDFSTLTLGNLEDNTVSAIDLRQDIVENLREIERVVNTSIEIPDQNRLIQAFDNNVVENQGSDIMNRKDVNFIKEVFFNDKGVSKPLQGRAVEIIGKDKLLQLRDKLQLLQFYEDQIKTIKDKNTEKNLKCN